MKIFLLPAAIAFILLPVSRSDSSILSKAETKIVLFASDSCLHLILSSDFHNWLDKMRTDSVWHPGTLSYTESSGSRVDLHVNIKIRGVFRRNPDNCNFPPLRIEFNEKETRNTIFKGIKNIKLVTHCRNNNKFYEQFVVQEFLVYKMYNAFTDFSYGARLVKMNYSDGSENIQQLGFFIEPTSSVEERTNSKELDIMNMHPNGIQQKHATLLALFQYMIGNTDWSIPALHNIVLLQMGNDLPFAVPFDFDCSGIVGSPYAVPQASLGIRSVKDRIFRGFCRSEEEFNICFQVFEENYDQIMDLYLNNELLNEQNKRRTIKYLNEFYETIRNPKKANSLIIAHCRQE
jgi:hypothetical protein